MPIWERDIPDNWYAAERDIFADLVGDEPEIMSDPKLQDLFDEALFDLGVDQRSRAFARDALDEYLWDTYGIDFQADFDWEGWREWYDSL